MSTKTTAKRGTAAEEQAESWTDEERAAMRNRAQELKAAKRRGGRESKEDAERAVLASIAEMPEEDRVLAEGMHAVVRASAPELSPRLWYGMPAYARDGKVVCHFQPARKFKTRYATFGFSDLANLDDGPLFPTAYALTEWTADVEARMATLVKKAVS
jgi:uncharacterized protein YdhG (YjbR/CyaY superfamily)